MDKAFLSLRDVSEKLGVSEKTVYRMLTDNQIPFAVKIGGQWRFRADAIAEWIAVQAGQDNGSRAIDHRIAVHQALANGSVLYRLHGSTRDEVIGEFLAALPYSAALDVNAVKVSVLSRESLVSSSLKGVAFLNISRERPVYAEKSMILLGYLEQPADLHALDHTPTRAVFLLLPSNPVEQEILDMKLRRLAMDSDFIPAVLAEMPRRELLAFIEARERDIFGHPTS